MAAANRGGGNQNSAGGGPPARRAWDDVFIFQPGKQMYDHLLQWVTTMLQQQQAKGLLERQRANLRSGVPYIFVAATENMKDA